MRRSVFLDDEIEEQLKTYRDNRKAEAGKIITNETALRELILKALHGVEPSRPLEARVAALEARLDALERPSDWRAQVQKAIDEGAFKIPAIKLCRELTGMTLKDAKEAIEQHWPSLRYF